MIFASNGKTVLATNVRKKVKGQTLYFRTYPTNGFASQAIGYSTQSRARAGLERAENSYLTGSNKNLGTILDTLGDRLKGTTITGNDLVAEPERAGRSRSPSRCSTASAAPPSCSTRRPARST